MKIDPTYSDQPFRITVNDRTVGWTKSPCDPDYLRSTYGKGWSYRPVKNKRTGDA